MFFSLEESPYSLLFPHLTKSSGDYLIYHQPDSSF